MILACNVLRMYGPQVGVALVDLRVWTQLCRYDGQLERGGSVAGFVRKRRKASHVIAHVLGGIV